MTVSTTILAEVTFPSKQPFVLLLSAFGQADLPRAAAELSNLLMFTGPLPVLPLLS